MGDLITQKKVHAEVWNFGEFLANQEVGMQVATP